MVKRGNPPRYFFATHHSPLTTHQTTNFSRNREMNRDPILFRVDGTTRTGGEHLARCLTYAAALQRRRRPTYFLSQLEPASLGLTIRRAGNSWLEADSSAGSNEDLEETLQEIRRLHPAAVVVDAPEAS